MGAGQVGEFVEQLFTQCVDVGAVGGVIDGQGPDVDAVAFAGCAELLDRGWCPADDGVRWGR